MERIALKAKKVVFFVAETPPSLSGSGIMAFRMAKYLSKHAAGVKMVSFNYNSKLLPREQQEKVQIRRITYFNLNILTKLLSFPWMIIQYVRHSIGQDICFIYGSYMPGYEIIMLFNLIFGIKTLFTSTLLGDDDMTTILNKSNFVGRALRKYLFRRIDIYWAINKEFQKLFIEQLGENRPRVILSSRGVDTSLFHPVTAEVKAALRKELGFKEEALILLSVGFLINRKGFKDIFESLSGLDFPFLYIVAGAFTRHPYHRMSNEEVNEMNYLYDLGNKLLGNRIMFTGGIEEVHKLYSVADIVLHGADREGTPNVVLEAMASCKPVIMKKLSGMDFFLRDNENIIVYSGVGELKASIKKLINNPVLLVELSENACKEIRERHSFESVAQIIFKIDEVPTQNSN
ncbi:MAG: glycosyltransferase family 4 protein [Bacteroidales bacterium]|nr:glycosyltransferase family 4 protein [Bacteroidales bacterium]